MLSKDDLFNKKGVSVGNLSPGDEIIYDEEKLGFKILRRNEILRDRYGSEIFLPGMIKNMHEMFWLMSVISFSGNLHYDFIRHRTDLVFGVTTIIK
ncbi:MAG TPA: hypothetical protein DIT25_02585 [Candidatus Moranbacteria bacterium]|nr:hypothetical protein [Candidatus Moranbacteria bacterium]